MSVRNIIILLMAFFSFQEGFSQNASRIAEGYSLIEESKLFVNLDKNKSMSLLNQALDIFQSEKDTKGIAQTFLAISNWYLSGNSWDTSLSLSLRALKCGDQLGDSLIQSRAYLNLGIIYFNLNDLLSSEKYSKMAILYGDKKTEASATSNLGMLFTSAELVDSAFYYFHKANQLFLSLDDSSKSVISNIAITNMNMGTIAIEKGEFAEAKKYFNKSLRYCYRIKDYNSIVLNYLNFGNVFSFEKKYDLAEEMIKRASSIADSSGLSTLSNTTTRALSNLYFQKGDYKTSYNLLDQFISVKDSLSGVDIQNKIANLQMKYEVEKQHQQITLLEKEKKLSIYRSIFIVFIIILLASIVIYYLNKRRLKNRRKIAISEKSRIETQNKLEKAKVDIRHFTKLIQENNERIECFEQELLNSNKEWSEELQKKQEKLQGMKILKDEDWVYYKTLFKELDAVFYDKMLLIPNLTEGDKRQVLLLKLGYTNKMSADVLGISTEGIKRARQRLAKKLGLKDAGKLEDYFAKL